ncbi:hypothetical protein S1OALGB6SA_2050 [Olavius algarvensis spirochete endosymbiont]|nr:hypothetical protein S1OALGB6SA_2050 [Olavius algarvensis spirochete endosymbiont]
MLPAPLPSFNSPRFTGRSCYPLESGVLVRMLMKEYKD